jgi:hypothetical protein
MTIVHQLAKRFSPDAHAVRFFNKKEGKWQYRKVSAPLTEQLIDQHLAKENPEHCLGAYVLSDLENSKGHIIVFDFDDHDGDNQKQTTATAIEFSRMLDSLQCPHLVFRSGGGNGYHICLVFEDPHPKSWLRAVGKHLLCEKAKLSEGTGGVAVRQVEIFPKNDSPGGQNVIALPLARKSIALKRDDDKFIEIEPPETIPLCAPLNHIKDPGYKGQGARNGDPRQAFLSDLLERIGVESYSVLQTNTDTGRRYWKDVDDKLTADNLADHETNFGVHLITDTEKEKGSACVIALKDAASVEAVINELVDKNYQPFTVTSFGGQGFYVWNVLSKPRRKDQLRKIATDACAAAGVEAVNIYPTNQAVELPLCGQSRFIAKIEDGQPQFGSPPRTVRVDKGRKSGPPSKTPDRDQAFEAFVSTENANDYESWVLVGHRLISAFGKDDDWAFEKWAEWSRTANDPADDAELERKWHEALAEDPSYSPATFWLNAKDNGYEGDVPFGKKDEEKFRALNLLSELSLFRSQDDVAFATIGPRHHVPVTSKAFEVYVRARCFDEGGTILPSDTVSGLVATLEAKCLTSADRGEVHVRVARHENKGYLSLGDDDNTVIEYDAEGFRVSEAPPVRFRKTPGSLPIPEPEAGDLDELQSLFNVNDENWAFLLSWMVMTLVNPGRPTPICVLNGEHGSAKTTALKQITLLIDPKIGATSGPAKSEDDLIASAYSSYIVSADNVSSFYQLADPWCRLATGGGLRKRQLYSDNALAAYDVIRPVLASGIDPTTYQQDLIERLLTIELVRPDIYISEAEVSQRFEGKRARCLGALLTLAGHIMAQPKPNDTDLNVRMADFGLVGELVSRHLRFKPGWFITNYTEMLETAAAENAESDPVFTFFEQFLLTEFANFHPPQIGQHLRYKSHELNQYMAEKIKYGRLHANQQDIPRNARAMSMRIFRLQKQLRELGIHCEKLSSDRSWHFEINSESYLQSVIAKQQAIHDEIANRPF